MDPNAALENIRALIESIMESLKGQDEDGGDQGGDAFCKVDTDDVLMLCDTFGGLDGWLKNGGFKPRDWARG